MAVSTDRMMMMMIDIARALATRLDFAIKDREDTKRYVEAYRGYLPELIRWQQERKR